MKEKMKNLPRKPKIKDYFWVIPMEGNCLQLRSINKSFMLGGAKVRDILPVLLAMCNGEHELAAILEKFSDHDTDGVLHILDSFVKNGILEDAAYESDLLSTSELERHQDQINFFGLFDEDRIKCQERLKSSHITLLPLNILTQNLAHALALAGVGRLTVLDMAPVPPPLPSHWGHTGNYPDVAIELIRDQELLLPDKELALPPSDLVIVALERPGFMLLEKLNQLSLKTKVPWMITTLEGLSGTVGPTIIPDETACYHCYQMRMKSHMSKYQEYLAYEKFIKENPHYHAKFPYMPALAGLVANLAALEAVKVLTKFSMAQTYGRIITLDFCNYETSFQQILKIPLCPCCTRKGPKPKLWLS